MTDAPIALSCGDPAGIGPELAVKAWRALGQDLPFFWIGDPRHLPKDTPIVPIQDPADAQRAAAEGLAVLPHPFAAEARPGTPSAENAAGVIEVLKRAVALVQTGQAAAMTTAPISKQVLIDGADFAYPGHTEFLAALAGVERVVMMLASPALRVVPATIHIPLSQVPQALTRQCLSDTITITADGLRRFFGIAHPRIAVAGLNPHAGEGGKLGQEEIRWINALVAEWPQTDMTVTGPHPADTMFHEAARSRYDVAIAMYHDQALIPIKTLDFDLGVNVTLGLPFIRTSPDHGTAFDIAGQGIANPTSLIEALKCARQMARAQPA
ncbi:4-hydroxythreonine-4-phosphate dehydrogenase PdxA [Aestuariivita sp.]|jgi:4-hydroxythreonine-4-phosphate dehydrogenase|uniref:4-hydroxythreonine-4-phosphate dehydrogenase PdxA n=1 Tax=Aestuariivita sp. TaxID=1872407 RepID=UPI002170A055|nr:4-hydroxythreonine-4-phosphate dehydrogenase PdxA [Aestuariivita sp.]MCE8007806.1 4-hydroxythreonine-4-phosphate dehydrogenase PdxA [Aestuariivita sp.]